MFKNKQFRFLFSKKHFAIEENYKVFSGLFGVCVGDALGVPVEFQDREMIKLNPVKGMNGYGTHNQPPGTWSDDSSLTFCLADSLCNGLNLDDISDKFKEWYDYGLWTHDGSLPFDIGIATSKAISNLRIGISPEQSGGNKEKCNGNGSLMRILPIVFYIQKYPNKKFEIIEQVSGITHAHIRSIIACSIYIELALNLLNGDTPKDAYKNMKPVIIEHYESRGYKDELELFSKILKKDIYVLSIDEINSSGYVVHTLEASLWSFLRSKTFSEAVLQAVNLGDDTDTIGAIVGGLAGLYYGYNEIPSKWIKILAKKNEIFDLCERYSKSLNIHD